ncbi:MAG TPA: hypothetical protein PLO51_01995, partial [Candidatus Micrarchaeota archaeon]|nr:hypothetical protein [Candidatus Micrarchaeota archaeon]
RPRGRMQSNLEYKRGLRMKLVLYVDDSELCGKARNFLKSSQLVFEEVNVKTPDGVSLLLKRTQQQNVPVLEIIRSHGVGVLADFNEDFWREQLSSLLPRK